MDDDWSDEELAWKVGQLFIVGFHGLTPNDDIKWLIQVYKVGGVILYRRNIKSAAQLLQLTNCLQALAKESRHKHGLFIAIDQENGLVTRIRPPVATQLPGSMALGATGNAENAYKIARATAETLKSFGINMNFAPVADINSESKNPIIGVRSPSDHPETVRRFVSAQVKGLKEGDIIPCVKHFPGHGDTTIDSHYGLPVISKTKEELDAYELIPFRTAVEEGVECVMTAHIALSSIEYPNLAASLNPNAIKILRDEMKYDGLIISNCLEMGGVKANFRTEKAAIMALLAGNDCVMISDTKQAQLEAIHQVQDAVRLRVLSQKDIETSFNRVLALKSKYSIETVSIPISSPEDVSQTNTAHATLASEVYAKSTTVVRNVKGVIPVSSDNSQKIVFMNYTGNSPEGGGASTSYIDVLRLKNSKTLEILLHESSQFSEEEEKMIAEADIVILATQNANLSHYQKDIGLSLAKKLGEKLIVIATCNPYDFLDDDEIENYIATYEPTIPAFKSAVDIIFGLARSYGHLPVRSSNAQTLLNIRQMTISGEKIIQLWHLWRRIFPGWHIALQRLEKILSAPHGKHYIHENGFCLSFLMEGPDGALHGKISAVGVLPDFRRRGLGSAFLNAAKAGLEASAGNRILKTLQMGSVFPRLWPQVPTAFSVAEKPFFLDRGFRHSSAPTARDMYKSIVESIAPPEIMARVAAMLTVTFKPWSADMYEECMIKQRRQFKNIGWVEAFQRLHEANQHHEVMVAICTRTKEQIGWTLMCSLDAVVTDDFAFLPLAPSREKTGLIGCVGVNKENRGRGVGVALLVKAMEDMRRRGIEGVCIDWVVIRGFYEKLGFKPLWEYDSWEW